MSSLFWSSSRRLPARVLGGCIALGCNVVGTSLHAEPAQLSLATAMQRAVVEAPLMQARQSRIAAAREDAARAAQLPDPVLKLGIDNLTATGAGAFDVGADLMTMRRVGVSQSWPSRRKRDARQAAANARIDEVESESELTRLEIERRAGEAWLQAWSAEAESAFLSELEAQAGRAADVARARLASATGGSAAVLAAESSLAALAVEQLRAQAQIQATRASLQRWLPDSGMLPLAPAPDFSNLATSPSMLRASLQRHARLQWWDERERRAESDVGLARAETRPDLGFGLSYGARSGRDDMLMLEVSVGLPLFAEQRQDRDIAARVAERDAIRAEREDAMRAQREVLERLLAQWQGFGDELQQFERELLPLSRDRSAMALAGYRSGESIQSWLDAHRDEITQRREYLQIRLEQGRAWLLLGTLLPRESLHAQVQP